MSLRAVGERPGERTDHPSSSSLVVGAGIPDHERDRSGLPLHSTERGSEELAFERDPMTLAGMRSLILALAVNSHHNRRK